MTVKSQFDSKAYLALLNRLQTLPGGYDVVEPGQTYPMSADTAFMLISDVRFDPDTPYVGGDTSNENRGNFNVSVMVPMNWTHAQQLGIAGLIRAHLPKSAKYTYDDVTVEILDTPSYVGTSYRDESWNRLPVSIRWRSAG